MKEDLTVYELKRARLLMEASIREATKEAIASFEAATRLTPRSIDIRLIEVATTNGDLYHLVERVTAEVDV